jgi:hypothetical protein
MPTNKRSEPTLKAFNKKISAVTLVVGVYLAACSAPETQRINPVVRGNVGAATKRPTREDLAVMVNGKIWNGTSDVDSVLYRVVGE